MSRRVYLMIMPFSMEKLSVGRPAMVQARILTGSPSVLTKEKSLEQGRPFSTMAWSHSLLWSCMFQNTGNLSCHNICQQCYTVVSYSLLCPIGNIMWKQILCMPVMQDCLDTQVLCMCICVCVCILVFILKAGDAKYMFQACLCISLKKKIKRLQ